MKLKITLIFSLFLVVGCALSSSQLNSISVPQSLNNNIQQVIIVESIPNTIFQNKIYVLEKKENRWFEVFRPMPAVVGRNGLAPEGEKREGDGRTPTGMFAIQRAFGYASEIKTGLDYRQATEKDFWVDDPKSSQYNLWVHGAPQAQSFETLKRKDHLYHLAAVIEYNTDPIVPGNGSAIFMHIWRDNDKPTSGCVAMSKRNMRQILKWLDKNKNPQILINSTQ